MKEIVIAHGEYAGAEQEVVTSDRLSLIGYVDLTWWPVNRYPLPLLNLDGQTEVKPVSYGIRKVSRVQGLSPSFLEPEILVTGAWHAQVDLAEGETHGKGGVYLGNANTPSETEGVIFERTTPYVDENELVFVREPDQFDVLHVEAFGDEQYHLIYVDPAVVEPLGRLSLVD